MGNDMGMSNLPLFSPIPNAAMKVNALCFLVILAGMQGTHAVEYTFTNNALTTSRGGVIYRDQIGEDYTKQTMDSATQFIWGVFHQNNDPADRKDVQKVSLVVMDDVVVNGQSVPAATGNGEIHISAKYVENYQQGDLKTEITGVLYHEMTHVWQWNGNNQAPGGLIEGIADFVRLKANYAPSHWKQPGEGQQWDQGYDVTARFLDYCDGLRNGFVADLNRLMRNSYDQQFFNQLLGKSVDQLWQDYKAMYGNKP